LELHLISISWLIYIEPNSIPYLPISISKRSISIFFLFKFPFIFSFKVPLCIDASRGLCCIYPNHLNRCWICFLQLVLSLAYHVYHHPRLSLYGHKSNTTYVFPQRASIIYSLKPTKSMRGQDKIGKKNIIYSLKPTKSMRGQDKIGKKTYGSYSVQQCFM
jgi:hypothetical protein